MKTTLIIFFISIITLSTLRVPEATIQTPITISVQDLRDSGPERNVRATYFEISEARLNDALTAKQLKTTPSNRLMHIFRQVNRDVPNINSTHFEVDKYYGYFTTSKTLSYDKHTPKYVPSYQFEYLTNETCPFHVIGYGGIIVVLLYSHAEFGDYLKSFRNYSDHQLNLENLLPKPTSTPSKPIKEINHLKALGFRQVPHDVAVSRWLDHSKNRYKDTKLHLTEESYSITDIVIPKWDLIWGTEPLSQTYQERLRKNILPRSERAVAVYRGEPGALSFNAWERQERTHLRKLRWLLFDKRYCINWTADAIRALTSKSNYQVEEWIDRQRTKTLPPEQLDLFEKAVYYYYVEDGAPDLKKWVTKEKRRLKVMKKRHKLIEQCIGWSSNAVRNFNLRDPSKAYEWVTREEDKIRRTKSRQFYEFTSKLTADYRKSFSVTKKDLSKRKTEIKPLGIFYGNRKPS